MREIKDWRKRKEQKEPPELLLKILRNIYPKDVADELFEDLMGLSPNDVSEDDDKYERLVEMLSKSVRSKNER